MLLAFSDDFVDKMDAYAQPTHLIFAIIWKTGPAFGNTLYIGRVAKLNIKISKIFSNFLRFSWIF